MLLLPMARFSLRIYHRRHHTENVGQLAKLILLSAYGASEAEVEATRHLREMNYRTHYAGLFAEEEGKFLRFWMDPGSSGGK